MGKALVGTRNGSGETVATGQLAAAPVLTTDQEAAILDALDASRAKATERVYKSAWGRFVSWADAQGYDPLPAAPETVAAYLASRAASGLSPASMKLDRAAIRDAHRSASRPDPTQHPGVANVARGIVRTAAVNGHAPRQAAGLTSDALAAIRATARLARRGPSGRQESEATARKRGNMDVAIASTMRDGLLRRSEAAALAWGDIELRSDGTGRLNIRRTLRGTLKDGSGRKPDTARVRAGIRHTPRMGSPAARPFRRPRADVGTNRVPRSREGRAAAALRTGRSRDPPEGCDKAAEGSPPPTSRCSG